MVKKLPAHATRILEPGESVLYLTRPRWVPLDFLSVVAVIALGLVVYAVLVEPGFIGLLILPALPFVGRFAAALTYSQIIFVTENRLMVARRFNQPLSLGLEWLKAIRIQQNRVQRMLGYGKLFLLVRVPRNHNQEALFQIKLTSLPDAAALALVITGAASAKGIAITME